MVMWAMAEVACLILTFPLTIALVMLFGWHCYLVVNNKTTIEHYEGVRSKIVAEGGELFSAANGSGSGVQQQQMPPLHPLTPGVEHPYSLGLWANLREILGRERPITSAHSLDCPITSAHLLDCPITSAYSLDLRQRSTEGACGS